MAEGKTAGCAHLINMLSTKKEVPAKRKKKQKKKTALEYGKLFEFPTFQHDKQTTSYLTIIFTIMTCIAHSRINIIRCIAIAGFTHLAV